MIFMEDILVVEDDVEDIDRYKCMETKDLINKLQEYQDSFDSGQVDFWFLDQSQLIMSELDRRGFKGWAK